MHDDPVKLRAELVANAPRDRLPLLRELIVERRRVRGALVVGALDARLRPHPPTATAMATSTRPRFRVTSKLISTPSTAAEPPLARKLAQQDRILIFISISGANISSSRRHIHGGVLLRSNF